MSKTTLHATRLARLSRANPAPNLTQLATPSPPKGNLIGSATPQNLGPQELGKHLSGSGSLVVGRGKLDLIGSPEATD